MYVVNKRGHEDGFPYTGSECEKAGVPKGAIYQSKEEAQRVADSFTRFNPLGFVVVRAHPSATYYQTVYTNRHTSHRGGE